MTRQTLTFLFTDIEGSTAMLRRLGDGYAEVLADHHELIRAALAAHGGTEVDTQGDAFFAVFSSASACVAAAIDMQRALGSQCRPAGGGVRVRMGIHSGEASQTATGLVGLGVHHAARVAAAAHGAQILVSAAAAALLGESLPAGASLRDFGLYQLKDFGRPEHIFQVEADRLAAAFPPLRSPGNPQLLTNLPAQVSSFVGRAAELAGVHRLVTTSRLVTLTGAGGTGKTRLALECAPGMLEQFADGVWLADLAGITEAELVPSRVMESLGVRQSGDLPVLEALRYRLRSAELMLILDSCEHLLDAAAELVSELLRSSPALRVLATSREPLGVAGEIAYPVPPLALPPEMAGEQASADSPAVRLFLDRSSAARGGVAAGAVPLAVVARICRELDGLPLAIELAAARASALSVEEIAAHLADKFQFLAFRRPAAVRRHQALTTAISWSYELLTERKRFVFRQLSVFAGGFELEPVAKVCCGEDQGEALNMIDRLVSKSLVAVEMTAAGTRYRLLETIRKYAAGLLAEAGEADSARARHAEVFLHLAEREHASAVLAREQDNFRAALDWSLGRQAETAPRLAYALGSFWLARGLLEEGRARLEAALARGHADARLRAGLLRLLGSVLSQAGDLRRAEAIFSEGSQVAETAGLAAERARIAVHLADIHQGGSDREALAEYEAAAAILEAEGDLDGLAEAWLSIGKMRFFLGDCHGGAEALERAAAIARRSGNDHVVLEATRWLVICWWMLPVPASAAIDHTEQVLRAATGDAWAEAEILEPLSLLYAHVGRFADARSAIARAKAEYARSGAKFDWAHCAIPAGHIELVAEDSAAAEHVLSEGCEAFRAMGERGFFASAVAMLAEAVYAQGRIEEAQKLTEQAESAAAADDIDAQARWRATRAKILARHGQLGWGDLSLSWIWPTTNRRGLASRLTGMSV